MRLRDAICLAGSNLRRNPVRTLLTILGLAVGIGAILTVITLGLAGEEQVETEIARLGVDKVWITPSEEGTPIPADAGRTVAVAVTGCACAEAATVAPIQAGDELLLCSVCGYDSGFEDVYSPQLLYGRSFKPAEYAAGDAVALIDEALASHFEGEAIGQRIGVGNRRLRIIGVCAPVTSQLMGRTKGTVIMPLLTFADTVGLPDPSEVTISIPDGMTAEETGRLALEALAEQGTYEATSLTEEIEAVEQVVRIFVMVLACVAAVCMLTGSIGVMNILLVSVRERRHEIGLIKAIGGTSGQVGLLFLLESITYALLGSLLGLVAGMAMIRLFGAWIGLEAVLSWQTALPTIGAAGFLGVLFGVVPALRAAGMLPVDALRQEN